MTLPRRSSSSPRSRRSVARTDDEMRAPIDRPARLRVLGADWTLLAVADERDAIGRDALGEQIVHGGAGPPLAEGEVVLVGAALVALALDDHAQVVRPQPGGVSLEDLHIGGADLVPIEVEVDALQLTPFGERRGVRAVARHHHRLAPFGDDLSGGGG